MLYECVYELQRNAVAEAWMTVNALLCRRLNSGVRRDPHAEVDDCGWLVTVRLVVACLRLITFLSRIQFLWIHSL